MYSRRDVIAVECSACNSQGFWTSWWWLRLGGRNMLEWLKNNKLINPKLICAFCWFVLFSNYENARSKNQNRAMLFIRNLHVSVPLCLLLNKPHIFSLTQHRFVLVSWLPYMNATRFGMHLGHPQACQYKNLTVRVCNSVLLYPEDGLSTDRNMRHSFGVTICIKANLFCVRVNNVVCLAVY